MEQSSAARLGTRYAGRYDLLGVLGEGGMGAVYRARHAFTGAQVALKIMHSTVARSANARDRFLREAQAPSAIGHPGIVAVSDAGVADDGTLYLALEILEGEDLGAAVEAGSVDGESLVAYTMELLDALGAAHESGLVHRDIKPDNVFLARETRDGAEVQRVRLLDFGITHHVTETADKLTQTGTILGTPHFMSPEQASGHAIDGRSDLYSVGGTMFYALTGRAPFEEPNYNLLIVAIMTRPAPEVRTVRPEIPEDLAAVVDRALSQRVEERFSSAAEMYAALGACGPVNLPAVIAADLGFQATQASSPGDLVAAGGSGLVGGGFPVTQGARPSHPRPLGQPGRGATTQPQPAKTPVSGHPAAAAIPGPGASVPGAAPGPPASPAPRRRTMIVAAAALAILGLGGGAAVVAGLGWLAGADQPVPSLDAGALMEPVVPVGTDTLRSRDAGAVAADVGPGAEPGPASDTAALAARLAELEAEAAEREQAEAARAAARARNQKRAAERRAEREAQEAQDRDRARQRCNIQCMTTAGTCRRAAGADRQAANICGREQMSCMRECTH